MKSETVIGALIAALILFGSNLVTLFTENPDLTFADIKQSVWVSMTIGALVAFLKDYQALSTRRLLAKVTGSTTTPMIAVVALAIGATTLSGCAGTRDAYKAADGLYETAFVVGEHYYAVVREANDLADEGKLTGKNLRFVEEIALQTRPSVLAMLDAAEAYDRFKSADTEADLTDAMSKAALAISRLVDAVDNFGSRSHVNDCDRDEFTSSCAILAPG